MRRTLPGPAILVVVLLVVLAFVALFLAMGGSSRQLATDLTRTTDGDGGCYFNRGGKTQCVNTASEEACTKAAGADPHVFFPDKKCVPADPNQCRQQISGMDLVTAEGTGVGATCDRAKVIAEADCERKAHQKITLKCPEEACGRFQMKHEASTTCTFDAAKDEFRAATTCRRLVSCINFGVSIDDSIATLSSPSPSAASSSTPLPTSTPATF